MIRLRPAVREHPEKPWGVAAGFVEHNAASDPAGMAGVADLAAHSSKCLAPLCNEDHAAALAGIRRDGRGDQERCSCRQVEPHLLPLQRVLCVDLRKQIGHDFCHSRVN